MLINNIEPIRVGDSYQYSVSLGDDHAGRALSFVLIGPQQITFGAVEQDKPGDFLVNLPSSVTSTYSAGQYFFYAFSSLVDDRKTIGQGQVQVFPDALQISAPFDARTHARKMLDAIEAVMEGRITKDAEQYSIRGRSLTRIPFAELIKLHSRYKAMVAAEEAAAGIAPVVNKVRPIFVR